jgi:hypothetical protein
MLAVGTVIAGLNATWPVAVPARGSSVIQVISRMGGKLSRLICLGQPDSSQSSETPAMAHRAVLRGRCRRLTTWFRDVEESL